MITKHKYKCLFFSLKYTDEIRSLLEEKLVTNDNKFYDFGMKICSIDEFLRSCDDD